MGKIVPKGTLLVSFKLTLRRLAFAGRDLYTNEAIAALTIFNEREISKDFLFWFLQVYDWVKAAESDIKLKGMTLNKAKLKELVVYFPKSLIEQKRIVAILEEAFESIAAAKANAQKNLENAKALFESELNAVFSKRGDGWKEKMLDEITSILGDGIHGTPKYDDDGEYYFVNGNNLDNGKIVLKETTKRVSYAEYEKHRKMLTNRTIMVSINGTLGNVAFYNNEKIILGKSACYFNLLENVDKHFMKYVILSPYFIDYAFREATGATIKNVSLKSMRMFKVPLPSIMEQKQIVSRLDSLSSETSHLSSLYSQKLSALEELKTSLLHQAFNGEL